VSGEKEGKHGVQSLEIGMQILQAILSWHRNMMLKEIAAVVGMPASKIHRYLVSMVCTGLVEQEMSGSRYNLGPFALNVGLVAMDRLDRVKTGLNIIVDLCAEVGEVTALENLFAGIREAGVAVIDSNHLLKGVAAVSAPVFNSANEITLGISVVGFQGILDTRYDGPIVTALKASAVKLSKKLGYHNVI